MHKLIPQIRQGFTTLKVADNFKELAINNLESWLTEERYQDYVPQIEYLCETGKWDLLLDCFYQLIPFGTGGRRGLVGIGPNRINPFTIMASAQGHSQYLLHMYGEAAKTRGVIIAYDVRQYLQQGSYDNNRLNPVKELSCKDLAYKAAEVYAANGIKVYLFSGFASTPELSFLVRRLGAVAGDMISASHNPPEYNGKKVVDETGGQLIPPKDERLVEVVLSESDNIQTIPFAEAENKGLIVFIADADRAEYVKAAAALDIGHYRSARVLFSPFHGTAYTSVYPVLKSLGFDIILDPISSVPDPKFSSIVFNIPNPEVHEAYINLIPDADELKADIILVADPDGDRIGLMSKEATGWRFFTGNEIMVLVTAYMLEEMTLEGKLRPEHTIVKTLVTTNLLTVLAEKYHVKMVGDLLVGIKYIADVMNQMDQAGTINDFLIGGEESHGTVAGNYIRDKDTSCPAIFLAELASREKDKGVTLGQFYDSLQQKYGCFHNYLTEIRLPGAEGMSQIAKIQDSLRADMPKQIGEFQIESVVDHWDGEPFLSESDKVSRNVIVFKVKPVTESVMTMQVTVRPSGTEPKSKMYFEIGMLPDANRKISEIQAEAFALCDKLEKAFLTYFYKLIGIDFPERGFLLFWQLPAQDKIRYFEIEPDIATLNNISDVEERRKQLAELLAFLGSDPVAKVDKAFSAQYGKGINSYLSL